VHRLLVLSQAGFLEDVLRRRGYTPVTRAAAGTWHEKRFA
jgi:hypothetical protein